VCYARLQATVSIELESGGRYFVAVGLCTLFLSATLDKRTVWAAILDEVHDPAKIGSHPVACISCERVAPASAIGTHCPRCRLLLRARKPQAVSRTAALTLASLILYIPANVFPMATLPIGLHQVTYTVLGGVIDLIDAHLMGLAALVFCASFLIPFLKLASLGWCVSSVLVRSTHALKTKTRLYRLVDVIGRWSMVDPLVLACFVPVTQFNVAISSRAEPAALAFTAVVYLTIVAARAFDPRLMWDPTRAPA
jgi:paraquat-inducible protein A